VGAEENSASDLMAKRKPPPPGYERHPLDPNLIRKIAPRTLAQVIFPHLRSEARAASPEPKRNVSLAEALYPNHSRRR
jgi:hypothetical protein